MFLREDQRKNHHGEAEEKCCKSGLSAREAAGGGSNCDCAAIGRLV